MKLSIALIHRVVAAIVLSFICSASSGQAAEKPKLSLKGFPTLGTQDTVFSFRAVLTGGVDGEDLYCLTTEWEWEEQADASLNESECPPYKAGETKIERVFTEEQSFRAFGAHHVRVVLRKGDKEIASAGTTVTVRKTQ